MTDDVFLSHYFEMQEHRSELARELGISPAAVTQRLRKIGPERIEAARNNGRAAVVVARALEQMPQRTVEQTAFNQGVQDAVANYHVFAGLEDLYTKLQPQIERTAQDMANSKKVPYFMVDQLCKLSARIESVIINAHKLKIDMVKAEGTEVFMRCMVEIYLEELPDVRERLYTKLARYGLEGQISILNQNR